MSRRLRVLLVLLTAAVDVAATAGAFYLAYRLRGAIPLPTPLTLGPFYRFVPQMLIHIACVVATLFFYRLYHVRRASSRIDLAYRLLSAVSIAMVTATALNYFAYRTEGDLTRGLIIYSWALTFICVGLGRALVGRLESWLHARHPDRLLIVGAGDIARVVHQKTLQSPTLGYRVIGFVAEDLTEVAGVPVLGTQAELARILQEHRPQEVVIALPSASHDELLDIILACEAERAIVRIFPDMFQIIAADLTIDNLDGLPLLTVRDVALRGWKLTVKRMMDLVVSAFGLLLLSPFMMLIALLIKLESKGPVFYAQERVGLDGKPFSMIKFRSMRADAEKQGAGWTTADDPRRTRLGAIMRRLSIDEVPQLINVLVGEMSLVGPRPERPIYVEQFKQVVPRYMERHKEKAGMTGWAQVNGLRGDTSIVERTKYDLYYIENWSLYLDLKIIVRTIWNGLRGDRHAY